MSQIEGLMELSDNEAEIATGGAPCQLVGIVLVDRGADGTIDEVWAIYQC